VQAKTKLATHLQQGDSDKQPVEVFFDGACPICSREIAIASLSLSKFRGDSSLVVLKHSHKWIAEEL
jgi:protein-disulfide isomerase